MNNRPTSSQSTESTDTSPSLPQDVFDVLVVGGGINGAGIARDLSGRGCKVLLCEKDDLASHTSSSSTKLIHGGLRYLEHGDFSLVRKALAEREVLLRSAPHIMWPLRFVMPHDPTSGSARPAWMIRLGLFLYDHLAKRETLAGSTTIDLRQHPCGKPLKSTFTKGFVYSDGWVDDARLVVLNAMDAAERGATVLTRWRCVDAKRDTAQWRVQLKSSCGETRFVTARVLVNAAGPWAAQFLSEHAHIADRKSLRLVKGSHIVVPKIFDHDHAYIFQNADKRITFAIPYETDFTLIGTTDVEHHGTVGNAHIDAAETAYLCEQASRYFEREIMPEHVVWSYSGVRPLLDDESGDHASAVTREYSLDLDWPAPMPPRIGRVDSGLPDEAPARSDRPAALLTVWGGKLTTYRKLAEEAGDLLAAPLNTAMSRGAWTNGAVLPGGDLNAGIDASQLARSDAASDFSRFVQSVETQHPELPKSLCHRLARAYGTRVEVLLARGLNAEVAPGVFEAELDYLRRHEWARTADDVLWRRSKLGLHLNDAQRTAVVDWCTAHWPDIAAPMAMTAAPGT